MDTTPPPIVDSPEATAVHLSYIRRDIFEIKNQLTELKSGFISRGDFEEHTKILDDHETRIRATAQVALDTRTQIKTWGTTIGLILGILEIALHYLK